MLSFYDRIIPRLIAFGRTYHGWLAAGLLAAMFGLSLGAMVGDSAIVDEVAHVPAGYSYVHYGDMRLNPEHPPLIKDLAGVPLQFMNLKFPDTLPPWTTDVNGQWEAGWSFLYHLGNNADEILFWARLPILLLAIGFGIVLYRLASRRWGRGVALLALAFYTFSPNLLAHAHYVTTDLGASVFMFLALAAFVRFVERPSRQHIVLLSAALAAANLVKFNGILLYPFLLVVAGLVVLWWQKPVKFWRRAWTYVGGYLLACVGSVGWIWAFYIPHTFNMPASVQDRLIEVSLAGKMQWLGGCLMAINDWSLLKPLAQYLLGVGMVYNRVNGGNVTYFNGRVTDQSFLWYFPELFAVKTQVAMLILALLAVGVFVVALLIKRRPARWYARLTDSWRSHVMEWVLGLFGLFYFGVSVAGNLNLGIRHILPVYTPLFVLVAIGTVWLVRRLARTPWRFGSTVTVSLLVLWYGTSTALAYPSYTAYFNELAGGGANAHRYFTDSSVDWGQDLRRLKEYVETHPEIDRIAVDYFGGGEPKYYFCQRVYDDKGQLVANGDGYDCTGSRVVLWHSDYGPYTGQYIAVSETYLQNDIFFSGQKGLRGYADLRQMEPIAKVGYSIYVFKLY